MAQDISKYDLEITELKSEIRILSERISIIKDNHLKHIEEKINTIIYFIRIFFISICII